MMSFLVSSLSQKNVFFRAFPMFPQCLSYHASQQSLVWKKFKYLNPNAHNVSYVFLGVLWHCIQHPQPPFPKKEKNLVQPNALNVSNVYFQHPWYCCLSFCHSMLTFSSFCCSPSFIILGVVKMSFYCWPCLGHSYTKTLHQFEFWIGMFKFGNVCYVNISFWDVLLGPWSSNNHIDLTIQFFGEKWIRCSLILKETKFEGGKYILLIWKEKIIRKEKKIPIPMKVWL
jgi:hypothetical protein